jgi:Flp pilus assembly protein TadD
VKQRLRARPGRIETLFELTGGNPRALGLIFELLRNGPNSRAVEDFEQLMDLTTPYYKARIEDLSEQAQVIMHALAVREAGDGLRFGHMAVEIAAHAGLPTGTVSAQLSILENEGLVEKSTAHGKAQYRIAEQLFRLWLQMRGTRRIRQNVILLTKFFEAMYDLDELAAKLREDCGVSPLSEAKFAFAIAATRGATSQRSELEAYGTDRLRKHLTDHGGNFDDYLPDSARSSSASPAEKPDNSRRAALLGLHQKGKEATADGDFIKAEAAYREAIEMDPEFAPSWLCLGALLESYLGRRDEAEAAYRKSIDLDSAHALPWFCLGDLLVDQPGRYNDAEVALRKATQLDPSNALAWDGLGILLGEKLERFDEAETAFRKAIELDPTESSSWHNLGLVLADTGRFTDAEFAYRKAIELDPTDPSSWNNLGVLLVENLGRYEEAENAFRKATQLRPEYDAAWNNLGNLLTVNGERYDEAEASYRTAIELNPANVGPWVHLGELLDEKLNRHQEAETAYRRAIEIDAGYAPAWSLLGRLLDVSLKRYDEAETAYRTAIQLDPHDIFPWISLGVLLARIDRYDDAEAAFRKALEIDPNNAPAWTALGLLLDGLDREEDALAAFDRSRNLNRELHPSVITKVTKLQTRVCVAACHKSLDVGGRPALHSALSRLLAEPDDTAAALVSEEFVEGFLAPVLERPDAASAVLAEMRSLGYEKHARPLVLAFEAALEDRGDVLGQLEPELQGATKRMFERLRPKPKKKKRAVKASR